MQSKFTQVLLGTTASSFLHTLALGPTSEARCCKKRHSVLCRNWLYSFLTMKIGKREHHFCFCRDSKKKRPREHSIAVRWQPTHSAVSTSHYMDWKHQRDTSAKLNLVEKAIKQTNKKGKLNHPSDGLVPTDVSSIPCWSVSHQMFPDFSTTL